MGFVFSSGEETTASRRQSCTGALETRLHLPEEGGGVDPGRSRARQRSSRETPLVPVLAGTRRNFRGWKAGREETPHLHYHAQTDRIRDDAFGRAGKEDGVRYPRRNQNVGVSRGQARQGHLGLVDPDER